MKRATTAPVLSSAHLLTPLAAMSGDTPEAGVMLPSEHLSCQDNPLMPGLRLAKIMGDAKKPGAVVHRVTFPKRRVVQAHSHPDDQTYTALSGTWYSGWDDQYDPQKLTPLPVGSFYTEPAGVPRFIAAPDRETIVQVTGTGPTAATFGDPAHAPKK